MPFEKLSLLDDSAGLIDMDTTGSGTNMDSIESFKFLSVTKVSPVAHSIPKRAQMSPAYASLMSFNNLKEKCSVFLHSDL